MGPYYLAIDIGASSGRHILGHLENGKMLLEEIYRFENRQIRRNGHDCWDIPHLWQGILDGLKVCKTLDKIPVSVGIDTWAVDFVLLDQNGGCIGDAVAYRDSRTDGIDRLVEAKISAGELYAHTGIQKQSFNTIYQLMALQQEHREQLQAAHSLLMIPDYFHYLLTGVQKQEYTNATSTGLVNAAGKEWDRELLDRLGLPSRLFGPLSMPGETVGPLRPDIAQTVGFQTTVVLPATHDTGSAFLAVPAENENAVYLSSGTWSLLGVENQEPITSEASRLQNFTNEGGAWYRYRYLKNIMGLWMIQSIRRELNGVAYVEGKKQAGWTLDVSAGERQWTFPDLIACAESAADFCNSPREATGAYTPVRDLADRRSVAKRCRAIRRRYSNTAFMRLTPADDDCSLTMRKCPSSPVRLACGPPQISVEYGPMEYTLTFSPYLEANRPTAPLALASSTVISSHTTGTSAAMASLTSFSTSAISSLVIGRSNEKSNRSRSSVMLLPFWLTFSSCRTVLSARCMRCVAVCSRAVASV